MIGHRSNRYRHIISAQKNALRTGLFIRRCIQFLHFTALEARLLGLKSNSIKDSAHDDALIKPEGLVGSWVGICPASSARNGTRIGSNTAPPVHEQEGAHGTV